MKKWTPWIIFGIFACYVLGGFRPPRLKTQFDLYEFGKLPVLYNGRLQPLDSFARNTLLMLRGKSTVVTKEGNALGFGAEKISAIQWLAELLMHPEVADTRKVFRIDYPDLQTMWQEPSSAGEKKYFSYATVEPMRNKIAEQVRPIMEREREDNPNHVDPKKRTPYEQNLVKLFESINLYERIKYNELAILRPVINSAPNKTRGSEYFETLAPAMIPSMIPPFPEEARETWHSIGDSISESVVKKSFSPAVLAYADMATAFASDQPSEFNKALGEYRSWLVQMRFDREVAKGRHEWLFNQYEPFIKSIALYVAALIFACAYWFNWAPWLRKTAVLMLGLAFVVHTSGLIFRMALEGRPPVTNLYSSAIFVGWGAVILGMILERIYRDGIGIVVSSAVGFVTLIIAHHLSLSGDTMEMLRAVLDTNIWLATHVVVITLGYSSMFVAGFLAILYVLRGAFTKSLTAEGGKSLARMVYGIICFATLFSFVGTILGGIWADQSWGRFWGWDPKENGALLLVLWNAVVLHARWGGMVRERGLMNMALIGNILTSFSWFGVNMLGIGLHSYGFMEQAFYWLMAFVASQLLLIAVGLRPLAKWKSFRDQKQQPAETPELQFGKRKLA